jgi:membrane-bound serine protease (ClpP class)
MVLLRRAVAVTALALGVASLAAPARAAGDHVVRLRLDGVIDQVTASYIREGIASAEASGAAAVLIVIDTPGGELTATDEITKAILNSSLPVITWVAPEGAQAASAGTFVTMVGDVAAMAPSTTIGAASVVGGGGEDLPEDLADKVNNSNAAKLKGFARDHNRNEQFAEDAIHESASVSADEAVAMEPPAVDLVAASEEELFAAIDAGQRPTDGHQLRFNGEPLPQLSGLEVRDVNMNAGQQFLHILSDPNIAFILFTIGFYGIVSELFHPNFFSGPVGAIALVLAFIGSNSLPLNVGGLLLILLGIGLLVLELSVTSFGLLTAGGVVCIVLGAFALWTGVDPEQDAIRVQISPVLLVVVIGLSLAYVFGVVRALLAMRRNPAPPRPMTALVGAGGVAQTLIAPTGIAYAGGEAWSARSRTDDQIAPGTPVRVVGVDGLELIVEPGSAEAADVKGPLSQEPDR